ncbi:cadherin-like domain-containing protein [Vibrio parahaemolyticus]|uniref:cadherin-like domain-containing protein n=1 Tax=Vibrio parahaemolyticus TaxID=670 RepID=UPI003AAC8A15
MATTTVTIVGGTSETDFTNEAIIDFLNENDEQYTITIDTVTQANGTYENVVPARDGATFDEGNLFSVTGTITNGMTVGTPDNAYVDEDQFVATDPTSTLTGTELDNGGVADPDGNSSSGATTLVNLTTVYDATEYEFQFEESLVLNSESDTDVSIPAAGSAELTSGGVTLEYVVSGNTFTAYAGAGRTAADKVFDIVMSNNTDDGGTDDAYVYTQYQNIDHPTADLATNPAVSDDTLTLTFGYRVVSTDINNSNESDILNFTVTVNDSLPENSPQSVSTNEDTAVTITISAEPFDNGIINIDNNKDGPQDIANGNSVDIYDADGNDLIGSLTNNGDGTVLFTPAANYNGQASFDYQVSDRDHDTASATVTINVLPIADGVTMQNDLTGANAIVAVEDNSNTNDSPSHTQTNFAIALGLVLPTVVDATDHTVTGTTTYDAIERQGLLYFVFDNTDGTNDGYLVGLDTDGDGVLDQTLFTLDSSNDGNSFSIYITDGDFHPTDLDNTGAIQLTQAEYAQLAISPIEDSHHNVDFTITTESHEVTDAGALLSPDVISSSSTQNVRVDLQAMTDPVTIELAVVNTTDTTVTLEDRQLADGAAGTDGQNDHINLTINEDENDGLGYVDLKAIILEQYGDLDGSENFRFEISSAADDGVQINVEGVGSRTISTTPVTFDFDVNDPYIRLTPPTNFSGDLSTISIRLIALDNDTDSTVTETETSDLVTLDVFVKPIADDVTLPDVTTVEDTAVKLFENIALTDTDGSESITTLLINNLPTGWVVKDHNGLILLTGNGTDDLSIDVATVGLANVQNYTITPPAHSSTDIALSVDVTVTDASTVDGTSESDVDTFNHTLNIEVTPFAERVDTNTDTLDADGTDDVTINPDHTYLTTNTGKEDGDNGAQVWFELGSIFAAETSNSLESHWSNEDDTNFAANAGTQFDSELTYAHLTLLSDTSGNYDDAGESVYAGGVYRYFDGTDYVVVNNSASGVDIPIEYLDSLEFIGPDQFAGDLKIKIEAKTVDYDEDGGSTNTQISGESYLRFTIDPVADDVTVAIKQSFGNEDAGRNVDGSVDVTSAANGIPLDVTVTTDDTDGSETYTIVLSDIPDGASIYYDGALISADSGVVNANITATNDAGGTWSVEIAEFDNAAAFNYIPVYNDNSDVTLTMSAQSIDGLDTGVALTNLAINVNVSGVADTPTHNATATNTITDTYSTSQNYNVIEHEDVGSVSLTSFFDSNNPGFSSADIAGGDGFETLFVKINLTSAQVSAGFSVSGAGVTMLTATSWLVASTDFANAQLNVPSNYSGEVDFSLDLQTVENDDLSGNTLGDSDFVNVPLSLLITPEAEGTVNQTATQNEDTAQILDFTFSGNGGPNESLTSIWINTESIPSDIQLVTTDHGTLTTTNNGVATWVELTVTNSVVETVTAEYLASGHDSDADYSFEFRYTVADTTVDGSAYTDITPDGDSYDAATIDYETATYNVTVNAVTDTATLTLGTITDNDGDGNTDLTYDAGSQTVTVTDNTVFGVPFTLTADDMVSEASNGQDIDGSERILGYVEVTGVPEGIDIVNGVYLGDIVDGNGNTTHTGRWRVAINDDLILDNAAGETNLIEFVVGRTSYVDINQLITIEVFHADNGAAVLSNTESFTLVIDGDTFGGTDGEDGVPMDIVVTPTPQDFVEDTPLTADQLLAVVDDAGSINDSSKYSITITNLSGATVTGMVNEGGFYSLTGEGDVNAVIASLQSIVITPNADQNINSPEQVAFDIVITTYGVDEHNAYTVNYTNGNELNIQPVTDQTTIEITGGGVSEDNATTFTIDLNNLADDGRNVLINNRLYIQVSDDGETENGSGNFGTFTFGDGSPLTGLTTINANDVQDEQSPANSLPPGSYYVIDVSSYNGTLDIRYTPPADQYGNEISLTAYALTQEDPDTVNSGYDTLTWLTSASQTTTVTPVNDGLTITPVMQGDEDAIALLSLGGVTLSDASESITGAVLRDVPFGYEVSLNGVALTGSISGEDADGNYLYDYNLNVSSEAELETVGIQRVGVEDFAGIITGLTLDVIAGESGVETAQSWPISVEFNPVADNLLNLTATKTLGDEYVWTAINLNANVKDADGSESLTVVFEGTGATALDNSAIFRLRDSNDAVTDIPSGDLTATFDAVLETWTIAGIPFDQLGDLEILYHAFDDDITVTVYTVDAVTGLPTDTLAVGETDVFNMSLDESQNIITGEEDNIIVTGDAGVTVDAGDGDDTITGGSGDDSITGGLGDDVITAGGGWDYVNFSGDIASYQFAYDFNTNTLTVSGPDGTDQIQGAEVLKFNGVSYQLKVGTTGNDTLDFIDSTKNLIIPGPGTDTVDANADDYIVAGDASSPTTAVLFSTLDDGSNGDVTPNDGQIIDGIIEGMYYETSSGLSGYTDELGGFKYYDGDTVTFSIGGVIIGTADAQDLLAESLFLQDLADVERTDLEDDYVQVMAVFLQSLDSEGNTAGGIQISSAARAAFSDITLNLSTASLADVNTLLVAQGYEPVDIETAMDHVMEMLIAETSLTEDDFVPFELQDEVVSADTLEAALFGDSIESSVTEANEADALITGASITDASINDTVEGTSRAMDNEGDVDDKAYLLVDDSLYLGESVILEAQIPNSETAEQGEAVDQGADVSLPSLSDLFEDDGQALPLPDVQNSEEDEVSISNASSDNAAADTTVVTYQDLEDSFKIDDSQSDF